MGAHEFEPSVTSLYKNKLPTYGALRKDDLVAKLDSEPFNKAKLARRHSIGAFKRGRQIEAEKTIPEVDIAKVDMVCKKPKNLESYNPRYLRPCKQIEMVLPPHPFAKQTAAEKKAMGFSKTGLALST